MKPIIFSTPMVRAILDGRKTQTRRVYNALRQDPYSRGDLLYVKEAWGFCPKCGRVNFRATTKHCTGCDEYIEKWKSSIHMFREDSRITLRVTRVRAQRLQDITEADAMAEGCDGNCGIGYIPAHQAGPLVYHYAQVWESLNAKREYSWDSNPLVWRIEFERVKP